MNRHSLSDEQPSRRHNNSKKSRRQKSDFTEDGTTKKLRTKTTFDKYYKQCISNIIEDYDEGYDDE